MAIALLLAAGARAALAQDQQSGPSEATPEAPIQQTPKSQAPPSGRSNARCASEATLKSVENTASATVMFVNNTGHAIRIHWINYKGERQFHAEVQPGQSRPQQTYLKHPWIMTDAADNCLRVVMPEARQISVSPPSVPAAGADSCDAITGYPERGAYRGYAFSAGKASHTDAHMDSLGRCTASNCGTITFCNGDCGALAVSTNKRWLSRTGRSKDEAEQAALAECARAPQSGGGPCSVVYSRCSRRGG